MAEVNINSLEGNSHKQRAEKAESSQKSREKISPVVKREQVVSTKKPLGKKFAETFMTEDAQDVKSWLLMDVVIPGIKNTILDILSLMFFGEVESRGRRRRRDRDDRVNYRSYYRGSSDGRDRDYRRRRDRDDYYDSDDRIDFRNIILRERKDAEDMVAAARRRIHDEGCISIAELMDLIDLTSPYTDNNYGWDDERDIGIRRVSSGYLIDVAEPKYIG